VLHQRKARCGEFLDQRGARDGLRLVDERLLAQHRESAGECHLQRLEVVLDGRGDQQGVDAARTESLQTWMRRHAMTQPSLQIGGVGRGALRGAPSHTRDTKPCPLGEAGKKGTETIARSSGAHQAQGRSR